MFDQRARFPLPLWERGYARAVSTAAAWVRGEQPLKPGGRRTLLGIGRAWPAAATTAWTRAAAGHVADRYAGCRVEELLQEGQFASARGGRSRLEGDNVSVLEAVVLHIPDFSVLVEMDGEDCARLGLGIEKGKLPLDAGNVVPGIGAEGGTG